MKRRQLIRYAQVGLLATVGTGLASQFQRYEAQTPGSLSVKWLGHTCFLFTGQGQRVLVNPFRALGCTAKYRLPKVTADFVLISSRLLDEGAVEELPGNPKLLIEPGLYRPSGLQFQGIRTDHDRLGGRRFGSNIVWRWTQAGLNILHLGGIAAPITLEQKILLGRPDVLLIPVGGSDKAYTADQAKAAIEFLEPKVIIPTHYRTAAADTTCELTNLDSFLTLMGGTPVRRSASDAITLTPASLPKQGSVIQVMSYRF